MAAVEVIKRYQSKIGEITITRYDEGGHVEYLVEHSNPLVTGFEWHDDKTDAIRHFQFLAWWSDRQTV